MTDNKDEGLDKLSDDEGQGTLDFDSSYNKGFCARIKPFFTCSKELPCKSCITVIRD
jgi:hypothetical protein